MGNPKGNIPWNKGKHGIYTEETRRRIGVAKRRKKTPLHKQRISESMKKIKQCSACSVKSRWIYVVRMPFTDHMLLLCDIDLIEQFHALSPEDKKRLEILQP
jgi:hypothetical protein